MIRWVTNWPSPALPKWQSRQRAARALRIVERDEAARDVGGVGAADRIMGRQPARRRRRGSFRSRPRPRSGSGRRAGRPGWRGSRGTSARSVGSPMPSRAAIACARSARAARARRGCARRPAVAGSCQSMISSWRTMRAVGLAAAVAGGAAAGGDADIGAGADAARPARPRVGRRQRKIRSESGEEARRAEADRDVAAAPQSVLRTALGPAKKSASTMGRTPLMQAQERLMTAETKPGRAGFSTRGTSAR